MHPAAEQSTFFSSLDFPGRSSLYLHEIGERLGVTVKHLLEQVDSGELVGLDIKSSGVSRRAMRIPVECYRDYVIKKLTGEVDFKMRFLSDLPVETRLQLIKELNASLKTNP